jgi:phospholipase C
VVLTQENRSFDHYFGVMRGVRGFGDRFRIPSLKTIPRPFHLDTTQHFELMRVEGTPHTWVDAQLAWDHGRMDQWPQFKGSHSVGYYAQADLPFHYALADAFTVCDAYHCSFQGGTNPNRLFLWTGTNDPQGTGNGPATYNDLDSLNGKPGVDSYNWTTYPERLQAAGISWQVYQDMADNYDDNPLAGFQAYRDAAIGVPGSNAELKRRALSTRTLAQLRTDVQANQLPQVSWIIAPAKDSEHPEVSSPAQGAHFTAQVLQSLMSNPEVWSRTVLFMNFDENDGYFDHVPPPAVPSCVQWSDDVSRRVYAGASTVDTRGEYHQHIKSYHNGAQEKELLQRPYGLGPRVPMLVISPWSRGGWVNSQVFDHTSIIRFMEKRFGVHEPNISAWRRAVCGDLTSAFDFAKFDSAPPPRLPDTLTLAKRAAALPQRVMPGIPGHPHLPTQNRGTRPSRALPYVLNVRCVVDPATGAIALIYENAGAAAAVFHEYDRLHPTSIPKRYTVGAGRHFVEFPGSYQDDFDLWVLGPNGFHRHFTGKPHDPIEASAHYKPAQKQLALQIRNAGKSTWTAQVGSHYANVRDQTCELPPGQTTVLTFDIEGSHCWYDLTLIVPQIPGFRRRFAGRMETAEDSVSDPA